MLVCDSRPQYCSQHVLISVLSIVGSTVWAMRLRSVPLYPRRQYRALAVSTALQQSRLLSGTVLSATSAPYTGSQYRTTAVRTALWYCCIHCVSTARRVAPSVAPYRTSPARSPRSSSAPAAVTCVVTRVVMCAVTRVVTCVVTRESLAWSPRGHAVHGVLVTSAAQAWSRGCLRCRVGVSEVTWICQRSRGRSRTSAEESSLGLNGPMGAW
eukprot:1308599-Rhodomonas_salina.2